MEITHVRERNRYEARLDGELAGYLEYGGEPRELRHTMVEKQFGGRGVGSALARFALDDARLAGRPIVAICPFVEAFIKKHPEYDDLRAH